MDRAPADNVSAMMGRHWGCLPVIGIVIGTIVTSVLNFQLAAYLYINGAYGKAAWEGGLRVVDNKGNLSDGSELSRVGHLCVYGGDFLLTVPVFLGLGMGLPYLRMRLRGERLGEQLARWKAENEEGKGGGRKAR